MKASFLLHLIAIIGIGSVCKGQEYKYAYYFDERLFTTNQTDAIVLGKGFKEAGLFRLDYFAKEDGYFFMTAHYKDSTLRQFEGRFSQFDRNGRVLYEGNYMNNQKNGLWQKWDSLGHKTDSIVYREGNVLTKSTFRYHKNDLLNYYTNKDSLANTYRTISYDDKGVMISEVDFLGERGTLKRYDSGSVKMDSLFTREEVEASFPGGGAAWMSYLQNNLDPSIPVRRRAPIGKYVVYVKFMIGIDGTISGLTAETNHGFGMEKEVIRIIKNSPRWLPASQYGLKVNAYRRQPITFVVEPR